MRLPESAEEDAQHRVGVGGGADRGAGVGTHPLLVDDDRGRQPVEYVDLGPGQRRHEALHEGAVGLVDHPLRLRGDRAEHQRALARARDAGEHRQPALRDLDADVGEVVHARAVHADQIVAVGNVQRRRLRVRPRGLAHRVSICWAGPPPSPSRTARVAARFLPVGLSVGVATSSASPSQSKDSATRYGAPSAEALATQTSMSWMSRCSVRDDAERAGAGSRHSSVLKQPEDVAIGVGDGGHQAAATDVVRGLLHGGTHGGHLGQLRLEVRHVLKETVERRATQPACGLHGVEAPARHGERA